MCWRTLSTLQTLCVQSELFESLVFRLTTKLDLICLPSTIAVSDDIEPDAAYAHAMLKTLSQTLAVKVQRKDPDVVKYIDKLVAHIFNLFISSTFLASDRPVATADLLRLPQVAGEIIILVLQSLPLQLVKSHPVNISHFFPSSAMRQESYSIGISKALSEEDVRDIAQGFQKIINIRNSVFLL